MARINKAKLTRLEIIQVATKKFIEKGFSSTSVKNISDELNMSTGNLTFYFPSKEHLLAELVDLLCKFQWEMMERESHEEKGSLKSICLELIAMVAMCEQNAIAKDLYISAYTSPLALDIIRRNDTERAKSIFGQYCSDWTEERYVEAEILASGIEYATLMTTGEVPDTGLRIVGAIYTILSIYQVPRDEIERNLEKAYAMDYKKIGKNVLKEFKKYVETATEQALFELLDKRA